jgi:acyl carrier protein
VPIGVPGELYIGGAGLARGYLNQPELTAEKFVANPFSRDPDSRLYRTGDRCRWRADGNLEFLGRLDDQVKLRGFRIELGEIEAVLNEHRDVVQSVVVLREDRTGDKRLVVYCVAATDTNLNHRDLRRHLQSRLPDYMLPSAIVSLVSLPLTRSGKLDRQALPTPETNRSVAAAAYVAPRTPIQELLSDIWQQVLGIDQIGIHDNFFELGGHSLLAIQFVVRIQRECGVAIPVRTLFETPTIGQLAERMLEELAANEDASIDALIELKK